MTKHHILSILALSAGAWLAAGPAAVDAAGGQAAKTGTIAGHVRLEGPSPGNPLIRMGVDPMCGRLNRGTRRVQEIVVRSADGGLANAVVDLQGKFPAGKAPSAPVTLDQQNCVYAPRVQGARVGQTLRVVNNDPLLHNVHSQSTNGNAFNFSEPTKGMVREVTLKGPDVVMRITCDVHSWMVAYLAVEAHPYYAVSGKDGSFTIANVPAGKHQIRVWHERFGELTKTVTVTPGKTATVDFGYTGKEKPSKARVQDVTIPLHAGAAELVMALAG